MSSSLISSPPRSNSSNAPTQDSDSKLVFASSNKQSPASGKAGALFFGNSTSNGVDEDWIFGGKKPNEETKAIKGGGAIATRMRGRPGIKAYRIRGNTSNTPVSLPVADDPLVKLTTLYNEKINKLSHERDKLEV